ncbi:MAG: periplasmic protein TonB [Blastocatellia bacterium]|jgi:TonB family protein|nr:periplasmic protein TonB [Blastocatellia bacterium]
MSQVSRILSACLFLSVLFTMASAQSVLTAKANVPPAATVDGSSSESDRARDGLIGPVRRVRTDVVKVSAVAGKAVEDSKHVVLETAEYDLKGVKTQNQYFPIAGATLTGREVYKYDDKGNISEMTLVNADGSLVSKEVYKYDYDSVGNWVKMTTSVAVVENGRIGFEPTEVTYRTIFYYLDAAMAKMLQPAGSPAPVNAVAAETVGQTSKPVELKAASALPPQTSLSKLKVSSVAPPSGDLRAGDDARPKVLVANSDQPPAPRPLMKPVSGGVLNGKAVSLPAPVYPEFARRARTGGLVEIEVVVDENGKVISARALAGPPSLRDVAVQAALHARFSPTKLSGQPVKITGRINYNFTLPQ